MFAYSWAPPLGFTHSICIHTCTQGGGGGGGGGGGAGLLTHRIERSRTLFCVFCLISILSQLIPSLKGRSPWNHIFYLFIFQYSARLCK